MQCLCPKKAPSPSGCNRSSRPSPPVVPTRCLGGIMHRRTQGTLARNVRAGNAGEGPLMPRGMSRGPQSVAAPFGRADRLPIRPCSRTNPDTPAPLATGGTGLPELTGRHRRRVGTTQHGRGAGGTSEVKVTTGRRVGRTSGEEAMSRTMTSGPLPLVGRTGIARSAETKKGRSAPTRPCSSLDTGQGWE